MYLSHFSPIRPQFSIPQEDAVEKLVGLRLALNPEWERRMIEKRIRRFGLANSKIKSRATEILDYAIETKNEKSAFTFFKDGHIPDLEARMLFYLAQSENTFKQWYETERHPPDHLIHVSCTGYTAPNAAQKTAAAWMRDKKKTVVVTNAYHMGCYASLPALRIAGSLSGERIDIAHNELCTLHFDPLTLEPEQIVVQSLFADGHIRYTYSNHRPELGFEIECLKEELIPETEKEMTWSPGGMHFQMHLSREIPELIKANLKPFVTKLLESSKHTPSSPLLFAIHPGGPKIIEAVEEVLGLSPECTEESHDVLAECGNMSSATLPHIWDRILKNPKREKNSTVVSLAFGPGLTLSGGVFRLCRSN